MSGSKVKYFYDYPENRAVAARLSIAERKKLAEMTGFSYPYIKAWLQGIRKSEKIRLAALKMLDVVEYREKLAAE